MMFKNRYLVSREPHALIQLSGKRMARLVLDAFFGDFGTID